MADQMKYLLVTVALCLLAGCGKPEANNPAADKPESEKTTYEKLVSSISEGQATYFESDEAKEYGAEVCMARAMPPMPSLWSRVAEGSHAGLWVQ